MNCKKDPRDTCICLKRKYGYCADCEKKAIKVVRESGRNLNEIIKTAKESEETVYELYIAVRGFDGNPEELWFRSAVDILRGVCKYCGNYSSNKCNECMWQNNLNGEDHWFFEEM